MLRRRLRCTSILVVSVVALRPEEDISLHTDHRVAHAREHLSKSSKHLGNQSILDAAFGNRSVQTNHGRAAANSSARLVTVSPGAKTKIHIDIEIPPKAGGGNGSDDNASSAAGVARLGSPKLIICGAQCQEAGYSVFEEVFTMVGKRRPNVLFIGAAMYDTSDAQYPHCLRFIYMGSEIKELKLTDTNPPFSKMQELFDWADVIVVDEGNTVFMVERLAHSGAADMIKKFVDQGKVLMTVGEAAIMDFDGGLSLLSPNKLMKKNPDLLNPDFFTVTNPVRATGLSILPGILCARLHVINRSASDNFDLCKQMVEGHTGEFALGVDESAAISIIGNRYKVHGRGIKGMGSGIYTMRMEGSTFLTEQAAWEGKVTDLARTARSIEKDPLEEKLKEDNPDDMKEPSQWWMYDPVKAQRYQVFIACDKDKSEALNVHELAACFDVDNVKATEIITSYGLGDGVLHPKEFVTKVMKMSGSLPEEAIRRWVSD